jgi:hypothetical protein
MPKTIDTEKYAKNIINCWELVLSMPTSQHPVYWPAAKLYSFNNSHTIWVATNCNVITANLHFLNTLLITGLIKEIELTIQFFGKKSTQNRQKLV